MFHQLEGKKNTNEFVKVSGLSLCSTYRNNISRIHEVNLTGSSTSKVFPLLPK